MNALYFKKHWQHVQSGQIKSLRDSLIEYIEKENGGIELLGLSDSGADAFSLQDYNMYQFFNNIDELLKSVIRKDKEMLIEIDNSKDQEEQLFSLGMAFLKSARVHTSDFEFFEAYIDAGLDVNFQDPRSEMTALHITAGQNGGEYVQKLINSKRCNYLISDRQFRLPHELATKFSGVSDICSRLFKLQEQEMINGGFKDFEDYVFSDNGPWRLRHLND